MLEGPSYVFCSSSSGDTYAYEAKSTGARLTNIEEGDEEEHDDIADQQPGENTSSNTSASYSTSSNVSYEYSFEQPIIENPSRANRVLYNIAKSHAFELCGRNYITLEDIPIVIKITLSTANRNRVSVLRLMITQKRRADNGGHLEHQTKFFT